MKIFWDICKSRHPITKGRSIACASLLAGVGLLWWLLVPKEPSYQGKTLTEWQNQINVDLAKVPPRGGLRPLGDGFLALEQQQKDITQEYAPVFTAMGPKVFPVLLKQLQTKNSKAEDWVNEFCRQREWWSLVSGSRQLHERYLAKMTLITLGDQTRQIEPELLRLTVREPELRRSVMEILSRTGANSPEFLQLLVQEVKLGDSNEFARQAFYRLRGKASGAVPELEQLKVTGNHVAAAKAGEIIKIITTDHVWPAK